MAGDANKRRGEDEGDTEREGKSVTLGNEIKRKNQVREEGKREKVQGDMHLEWPTPGSQLRNCR